MAALEILQYIVELADNGFRIEGENAADDMVGAGLVGRVEIARLCGRLERPHDDPGGVGTQIKCLPVQEGGSLRLGPGTGQRSGIHAPTARSVGGLVSLISATESWRISARPNR